MRCRICSLDSVCLALWVSDVIITVENLASCLPELSLYEQKPEGDTAQRGEKYSIRHSPSRRLVGDCTFGVYAIENPSGRVYVGQTANLRQRISMHNSNRVLSTKNEGPWKLICWEGCPDRDGARWLEFQLKHSNGRRMKWITDNRVEK